MEVAITTYFTTTIPSTTKIIIITTSTTTTTSSITTSSNIIITNSVPISKPLQRLHPSSRTSSTNITTPTSASTTVANHQNTFSSKLWRNTSPTKRPGAKFSTCFKRNSSFKELPQDHFRHSYIFLTEKKNSQEYNVPRGCVFSLLLDCMEDKNSDTSLSSTFCWINIWQSIELLCRDRGLISVALVFLLLTVKSNAMSEAHHEALRFLCQAYYFVLRYGLERGWHGGSVRRFVRFGHDEWSWWSVTFPARNVYCWCFRSLVDKI